MCGWLSLPASEASATKALCFMRSVCGSASRSNRNTLMATSRSVSGSRARYTELVAPLPISRISGYLPSCSCSSNFIDLLEQLGLLERLAEEGVDPQRGRLAAMLLGGARGDDDDRDVLRARVAAHLARQIEAVHARHLDVHQHYRRQGLAQLLQRLQPVLGGDYLVALALEQAAGDLAHGERIVDHHDERGGRPALGRARGHRRHQRGALEARRAAARALRQH